MKFPDIGLLNRFYLGDTVLLEPIADAIAMAQDSPCYVLSNYGTVFENHPRVAGISFTDPRIYSIRVVDMTEAIASTESVEDGISLPIPGKIKRMYEAAGVSYDPERQPTLYLSDEEHEKAREFSALFPGKCLGVAPSTNIDVKAWPYMRQFLRKMSGEFDHIFAFAAEVPESLAEEYCIHRVIGRPLRDVMCYLSVMDCFFGVDTGVSHLAAALAVPTVVCGFNVFSDLYESYSRCEYISAPNWNRGMAGTRPSAVGKAVKRAMVLPKYKTAAIMLLEGLGGTVTLSDHAKKYMELTGKKAHVIVRKHPELFAGNPHIDKIIQVGNPRYREVLPRMIEEFPELICIKTGVGVRYVDRKQQETSELWQELYDAHPLGKKALENYGLNMVGCANLSLGWDARTDDVAVFSYGDTPPGMPDSYVAFSNGVDTWHRGLKQTKCWENEYWQALVSSVDMPFVQLGTEYDPLVRGSVDMRMKTDIPQLLRVLRDATAIVCTEGGLMHLAHAVGNTNTIVLKGPTRGNFYGYRDLINLDSHSCEACHWDTPDWYENCPKGIGAVCMKSIRPGRVIAALERTLNEDLVQDARIPPLLMGRGVELPAEGVC